MKLGPALTAAAYLLAAIMFLSVAREVFACGVCVEDRVAASYDHAVVVRSLDRKHQVVFLAIEGEIAASPRLSRQIRGAVESAAGVDRSSARVSLAAASLSFAYDPSRHKLGPIMSAIEKSLAPKGLSVSLLRVIA
jgi:hypothetical protein